MGRLNAFRIRRINQSLIITALAGALMGCLGGGGNGGGGGGETSDATRSATQQAPDFDVLTFDSDEDGIIASIPATSDGQPHITLTRNNSGVISDIDFEFDDGGTLRAFTSSVTGRIEWVWVRTADGHGYQLQFENYDDAAGTVEVSASGHGLWDEVTATVNRADTAPASIAAVETPTTRKRAVQDTTVTSTSSTTQLTGTWSVTETIQQNECGVRLPAITDATYTLSQIDNSVESFADSGEVYRGRVGSSLTWTGERVTPSGLWERSLQADIREDGQRLEGVVDWSVTADGEPTACSGRSTFSASAIGGVSMAQVAPASTDLLNESLDEALETLSDPFETYLPLNIYKEIGETVVEVGDSLVNMAESVQERFTETREMVSDAIDRGGEGIRSVGHQMSCWEFDNGYDTCAREIGQRAKVLSEEIFRLDRDDVSASFVATDDRFVQPQSDPWEDLFVNGTVTTEEMRKTNVTDTCAVTVLGVMNPDCPQYDDPLTWSETDSDGSSGGYIGSGSTYYVYSPIEYDYSEPTGDSPSYSCVPPGTDPDTVKACPR